METPSMFPAYTKTWHDKPYPAISLDRPELSAQGKVVVITGGGTGIGAGIARAFAQAGASGIGIIGRRENPLISSTTAISAVSSTTKVSYAVADLTNKQSTQEAFKALATSLGKIDILVSNAGFLPKPAPLTDSDDDDWWAGFEINVRGGYNAIRAFLPLAAANPILLSINTGVATLPSFPSLSSYAASKVASAKMHEYLQAEHPELHVVNVHPGVVETDMNVKSGFGGGMDVAELPAAFTVWLASPEAKFLKGKFAWVNWDVEELKARAEQIQGSKELELTLLGPEYPPQVPTAVF